MPSKGQNQEHGQVLALKAQERAFCRLYHHDGDAVAAYTGAFRANSPDYARKAAAKLLRRDDIDAFLEGLPQKLTSDRLRISEQSDQ